MGDLFDDKNIKPMLIAEQQEPFDSEEYIFEIKFDGIRCIAYLGDSTDIRNKKDVMMVPKLPELMNIHEQILHKCILDGELVVLKNGDPDFYEIQRRAILTDKFKIQLAANKLPATFIAYDILYYKDKEILNMPLIERKQLLQIIVRENDRIIVSRYIEQYGTQLYNIVKQKKLEGIVAKKKDSKYQLDKRSKLWIKCKIYNSVDAVVCGFIRNKDDTTSIIIGQYKGTKLVYKGHVKLGAGMRYISKHGYRRIDTSPFGYIPYGSEDAVWIEPNIVCLIEYMPSDREAMRLAVFKGIRKDKTPMECQSDE
jgi:ATP-dependent DNA ligase